MSYYKHKPIKNIHVTHVKVLSNGQISEHNISEYFICIRLNGLFLFVPDTLNKAVLSDKPRTVCELINQPQNQVI